MSRGRGAHYVSRVKDKDKREVAFSLVPSNLGKKGKVCGYSAWLTHNQVLVEDAVVSEMCEDLVPMFAHGQFGRIAEVDLVHVFQPRR